MDVNDINTIINSVGFPIAAFCAMWWMCNETIKQNTEVLTDIRIALKELSDKLEKEEA